MKERIYEKPEIDVLKFGDDVIMDVSSSGPDTYFEDPWGNV